MTDGEKIAILHAVDEKMSAYTAPFITTILGVISETEGELVGSAQFLNILGNPHLLTAAHVALEQKNPKYKFLAFSPRTGQKPVPITSLWHLDVENDLAVSQVSFDDIFEQQLISFDSLAETSADLEDILFFHAFPGRQSRFSAIGNGVYSDSLGFGTFLGATTWEKFDLGRHFALQYSIAEAQQAANGTSATLPEANGLSGSAVWKTGRAKNHDWCLAQAKIVGILHRWDKDCGSVIATRVEVIREMVKHFFGLESCR